VPRATSAVQRQEALNPFWTCASEKNGTSVGAPPSRSVRSRRITRPACRTFDLTIPRPDPVGGTRWQRPGRASRLRLASSVPGEHHTLGMDHLAHRLVCSQRPKSRTPQASRSRHWRPARTLSAQGVPQGSAPPGPTSGCRCSAFGWKPALLVCSSPDQFAALHSTFGPRQAASSGGRNFSPQRVLSIFLDALE
jgi:hypothetical protein